MAAGPASDLGPAAPAFLRDLAVDPALAGAAALLHSLEAHRQDLRDALLRGAAVVEGAEARGRPGSVDAVRRDCAVLEARIEELDGDIARAWDAGGRRALTPPG